MYPHFQTTSSPHCHAYIFSRKPLSETQPGLRQERHGIKKSRYDALPFSSTSLFLREMRQAKQFPLKSQEPLRFIRLETQQNADLNVQYKRKVKGQVLLLFIALQKILTLYSFSYTCKILLDFKPSNYRPVLDRFSAVTISDAVIFLPWSTSISQSLVVLRTLL